MSDKYTVIWKGIYNLHINVKMWCIYRTRTGKRMGLGRRFTSDYGDVPVAVHNAQTAQLEAVENKRGYAYALRNALRYRKTKNEKIAKSKMKEFKNDSTF